MNRVTMIGRLTNDPQVRVTSGEEAKSIARFTIAVNRGYKKEGRHEADFFNTVSFGKVAEFVEKYFKKGQQVAISGKLQNNQYQDKEGNTRYDHQILVEEVFFAEGKKDS